MFTEGNISAGTGLATYNTTAVLNIHGRSLLGRRLECKRCLSGKGFTKGCQ